MAKSTTSTITVVRAALPKSTYAKLVRGYYVSRAIHSTNTSSAIEEKYNNAKAYADDYYNHNEKLY